MRVRPSQLWFPQDFWKALLSRVQEEYTKIGIPEPIIIISADDLQNLYFQNCPLPSISGSLKAIQENANNHLQVTRTILTLFTYYLIPKMQPPTGNTIAYQPFSTSASGLLSEQKEAEIVPPFNFFEQLWKKDPAYVRKNISAIGQGLALRGNPDYLKHLFDNHQHYGFVLDRDFLDALSISHNRKEALQYCLRHVHEYGFNLYKAMDYPMPYFTMALALLSDMDIEEIFYYCVEKHEFDPNVQDNDGYNFWEMMAHFGNERTIKWILENGPLYQFNPSANENSFWRLLASNRHLKEPNQNMVKTVLPYCVKYQFDPIQDKYGYCFLRDVSAVVSADTFFNQDVFDRELRYMLEKNVKRVSSENNKNNEWIISSKEKNKEKDPNYPVFVLPERIKKEELEEKEVKISDLSSEPETPSEVFKDVSVINSFVLRCLNNETFNINIPIQVEDVITFLCNTYLPDQLQSGVEIYNPIWNRLFEIGNTLSNELSTLNRFLGESKKFVIAIIEKKICEFIAQNNQHAVQFFINQLWDNFLIQNKPLPTVFSKIKKYPDLYFFLIEKLKLLTTSDVEKCSKCLQEDHAIVTLLREVKGILQYDALPIIKTVVRYHQLKNKTADEVKKLNVDITDRSREQLFDFIQGQPLHEKITALTAITRDGTALNYVFTHFKSTFFASDYVARAETELKRLGSNPDRVTDEKSAKYMPG